MPAPRNHRGHANAARHPATRTSHATKTDSRNIYCRNAYTNVPLPHPSAKVAAPRATSPTPRPRAPAEGFVLSGGVHRAHLRATPPLHRRPPAPHAAQRRSFRRVSPDAFVPDLRTGRPFRPGLRVKRVQRASGVYETTWSMGSGPAGRATWQYGPEASPGTPQLPRYPRHPHQHVIHHRGVRACVQVHSHAPRHRRREYRSRRRRASSSGNLRPWPIAVPDLASASAPVRCRITDFCDDVLQPVDRL